MRERAEVDVGQQRTRVVGESLLRAVDRVEFHSRGAGLTHDVQRGDPGDRRIRLVDDDRPRTVRVLVGGHSRRPVDGTHLRAWVGRDRGGVEGRVLDGVAHSEDVVVAHRLHIEQRAAVVEVELAVPPVVHGIAKVHELRWGADVELQALEDGYDVVAFVAQRLLHPLGVDGAGRRPLLDRDLQHLFATERLNAPSHSGPVDHLADQKQLGYQGGQLLAGETGVAAAGNLSHCRTPSTAGAVPCSLSCACRSPSRRQR